MFAWQRCDAFQKVMRTMVQMLPFIESQLKCQAQHEELPLCYYTNFFNSFQLFVFVSIKLRDKKQAWREKNATAYK